MDKDILDVRSLVVYCQTGAFKRQIVKDISFSLKSGESLAIVGESGSGKTLTAMSLFQLLPVGCFSQGEAFLNGNNLLNDKKIEFLRGKDIVLIPQSGVEFLNPVFKIRSQIFETLVKLDVPKNSREKRARELLIMAGFTDPEDVLEKYPFEISGGMAQRVILAIGMAVQPRVVVADEPTRGIDGDGVNKFINLLETVFKDTILIIITHNIGIAQQCGKLLVLFDGEVMEFGPCRKILSETKHPYTVSLMKNLPTHKDYLALTETKKNIRENGEGCPYSTRCNMAQEVCFTEHPNLVVDSDWQQRCFYARSL